MPPYTKPTQDGVLAHFRNVAAAAPALPIIAYNVPSRTATNLLPATVRQLWQIPNIVALKESSGDLQQIGRIAAGLPPDRVLLSGDDALALATIAAGGDGLVSVAGNVVPGNMRDLVNAARAGDLERARCCQAMLQPLFDALCAEPNPIGVKAAIELIGVAGSMVRLPLLPANDATRDQLGTALARQREVVHG